MLQIHNHMMAHYMAGKLKPVMSFIVNVDNNCPYLISNGGENTLAVCQYMLRTLLLPLGILQEFTIRNLQSRQPLQK